MYVQGVGIDSKLTRIPASGGRRHYVGDQVGTMLMTLADNGDREEQTVMDAWGLTIAGDTNDERYAYAQRDRDSESGFDYMRHRMYDPRIGRFTQVDPIGFDYLYATNCPVSGNDPSGLIVQFTTTQGSSRREAESQALGDWLGYDLHVTGAGIVNIINNRGNPMDRGSWPREFAEMVASKNVYSVEGIYERINRWNTSGFAEIMRRSGDYYAKLRPDMLDTDDVARRKGGKAGWEGLIGGATFGAVQASEESRQMPGFGISRGIGMVLVTTEAALLTGGAAAGFGSMSTNTLGVAAANIGQSSFLSGMAEGTLVLTVATTADLSGKCVSPGSVLSNLIATIGNGALGHFQSGGGRGTGLRPDPNALGPHSTFRRDPATKNITHYATWSPQSNPKNPAPWQMDKRVDITGAPHFNKVTGQFVPTPHVADPGTPGGVRPATADELPRSR